MMAGKKLERASSEFTGTLFEPPNTNAPSVKIMGTVPRCPLCQNYGYVNCPQAKAPNGGDFLAVAFQQGTACSCPAGAQFAQDQMEWMR